jgi:uncharacterized protein
MLFEVKERDSAFYRERLSGFLPDRMIDMHTHIWLGAQRKSRGGERGTVQWVDRVASENSVEDLVDTYRLMFPGKQVLPLVFGMALAPGDDLEAGNDYVRRCAAQHGLPSLIFATPSWGSEEFEARVTAGGFLGAKVYLTWAPPERGPDEIEIFDFLPRHQLEVMDRHGWIALLHVPRAGRLRDPANLQQIIEIERRYPRVILVVAHVGRAYCPEDVGNAFEVLAETRRVYFDISANTSDSIFEQLIRAVGPRRILFGSDLPITRMRMRRICERGTYVNLVPPGLYGDVSGDRHMRVAPEPDAGLLTFFMYEEIDAFRRAAARAGLTPADVKDVFFDNARRILSGLGVRNPFTTPGEMP